MTFLSDVNKNESILTNLLFQKKYSRRAIGSPVLLPDYSIDFSCPNQGNLVKSPLWAKTQILQKTEKP